MTFDTVEAIVNNDDIHDKLEEVHVKYIIIAKLSSSTSGILK